MWLFLWVLIVLGAIGFFLWSYHELFEQKRLWKAFAGRHNLLYQGGKFSDSPAMTGDLKGRKVNFYPQLVENAHNGMTTYNVVEIFLNQVPQTSCVVANIGFSDFVAAVDLPEPFEVDHANWPKDILARQFVEDEPAAWFLDDETRINAIQNLAKLPFHVAFVADGDQAFVAIRTANPLNDEKKFNMLIKKLYEIAAMLETDSAGAVENEPQEEAVKEEIPNQEPDKEKEEVLDDPNLPPMDTTEQEDDNTQNNDNDTKPLI